MIRIAALNDSEDERAAATDAKVSRTAETTKECQETDALTLYTNALKLQTDGRNTDAEAVLKELLMCDYVNEACSPSANEGSGDNRSMLKYLAYKNLSNISAQKQDYRGAIEAILEAVKIDSTDVTMWYKLGVHAKEIDHITLARFAFVQGLSCNPGHWPCLDNLITILYALGDYTDCLYYISKALEKDIHYAKGIVFRRRMYAEQSYLQESTAALFEFCESEIEGMTVEPADEAEFVNEAILMSQKRVEACGPEFKELPKVSFPCGLDGLTWIGLGKALIQLYDHIACKKPDLSFCCSVDVAQYMSKETLKEQLPIEAGTVVDGSSSNYDPLAKVDDVKRMMPDVPENIATDDASILGAPCLPTCDASVPIDPPPPGNEFVTVSGDDHLLMEPKVGTSTVNLVRPPASSARTASGPSVMARRVYKKRKSSTVTCLDDPNMTRRSARVHVRNAHGKKEDGKVNYNAVLSRLLPVSLTTSSTELSVDRHGMLSVSTEQAAKILTSNVSSETGLIEQAMPTGLEEEREVEEFLTRFPATGGVLDLMRHYLIELAGKHRLHWPRSLVDVFISVFEKHRQHMSYPSYRCDEAPSSYICSLARVGLLQLEFTMDKAASMESRKARPRAPPKNSPKKQLQSTATNFNVQDIFRVASCCGCSFVDMLWLGGLTDRPDILGDTEFTSYSLRFFWAVGLLMLLEGSKENAAANFDRVRAILDDPSSGVQVMKLVNCQNYNVICSRSVESQLQALQCSQSLDGVQQLYEEKNYEKVVDLLFPTCAQATRPDSTADVVALQQLLTKERHLQLLLLQSSLLHLKNYLHAAMATEASIYESLAHYQHATAAAARDEWVKTICQLMKGMIRCFIEDRGSVSEGGLPCTYSNAYSQLSAKSRQRLASSTIQIAEMILEAVADSTCDMPQDIVTPWILLYHIVKQEEDRLSADRELSLADSGNSSNEVMPASLVLLNIAHEYIGRRSWCNAGDGSLLLFSVEVFLRELERNRCTGYHDILERSVEQCFFCLYSHPNKKAKAKHLEDHGCTSQVILTWKQAIPMFEFFKPKIMPSFDSYKSSAVSLELEILFGRIVALVPTLLRPTQKAEESVLAYIDGSTPTFSFRWAELSLSSSKGTAVVKEIFYLLADYYFKNKEPCKAIKYYVTDICLNPGRFDSWAGLALAKCSKLESRLSSVETQVYDDALVKLAHQTLRCFEKALELDGTNSKLWIEYGSTAYHLASCASRLLKQGRQSFSTMQSIHARGHKENTAQSDDSAGSDDDESWERLKKLLSDSLTLARRCYSEAARRCWDVDDFTEEWLHHYMLGKIAEKFVTEAVDSAAVDHKQLTRPEACRVYLDHYKMAANFLHEDGAPYPKKISFISSAPSLAIEVLEMYYRLHVSILKYLNGECTEEDYLMLKQYIDEAQRSPFAMSCETKRGRKSISADSVPATAQERKQDVGYRPPSSPSGLRKRHLPYESAAKPTGSSTCVVDDDVQAIMTHILDTVVADCDGVRNCQQAPPWLSANNDGGDTEALLSSSARAAHGSAAMKRELALAESVQALAAAGSMDGGLPALSHSADTAPLQACSLPSCSGTAVAMTKAQKQELAEQCLKALRLCAMRYPLHYKSYYRIAHTYVHLDCMKDMRLAREVLLGVSDSQGAMTVCNSTNSSGSASTLPQGLFQERKPNNFFNGVWRIPVAEIERPGSFAAHLCRTTELVLKVLESEHDADLLCQLHMQLARAPDPGKKFLCDSDRLRLAGLAYSMSVACYERLLNEDFGRQLMVDATGTTPTKTPNGWLLNVYRLYCYGAKKCHLVEKVTALFSKAFKIYRCQVEEVTKAQLEEATQFCQQLIAATPGRQGPVTGSSLAHRSIARDKTSETIAIRPCAVNLTAISQAQLQARRTLSTATNIADDSTDQSSFEAQPHEPYSENAAAGNLAVAVPADLTNCSAAPSEKSECSSSNDSCDSSDRVHQSATLVAATTAPVPRLLPDMVTVECVSLPAVTHSVCVTSSTAHSSFIDSSAWLPSSQVTIATDLPSLADDGAITSVADELDMSDEYSCTTVSTQGGDGVLPSSQISDVAAPPNLGNESQSMETNGMDIRMPRASELPACELISQRSLFGNVSSTDEEVDEPDRARRDHSAVAAAARVDSSSCSSTGSSDSATDSSDNSTDNVGPSDFLG